jgi:hypothetical protein
MDFIYIVLLSAAITGGIVYLIHSFSRPKKRPSKRSIIDDLDFEIDEDFLEDVDEGFEGRVYGKVQETPTMEVKQKPMGKISDYPPCFGTLDVYNKCKKDCNVLNECASTIKMLKRL